MKKILLAIIFTTILIPGAVFATTTAFRSSIIFSYGLEDLEAHIEIRGESGMSRVVILGDNVSQVVIRSGTVEERDTDSIHVKHNFPVSNNYIIWKITGANNNKPFFVTGYTSRINSGYSIIGNNLLLIHTILVIITLLLLAVLMDKITARKKGVQKINISKKIIVFFIIIISIFLSYQYIKHLPKKINFYIPPHVQQNPIQKKYPDETTDRTQIEIRKENNNDWYGDIYYVDAQNNKKKIAESKTVENELVESYFDSVYFTNAYISPDKKWIALTASCWEDTCVYIYDAKTEEMHETNFASEDIEWLEDNHLQVIGRCTYPSALCGTYKSVNTTTPWILEEEK